MKILLCKGHMATKFYFIIFWAYVVKNGLSYLSNCTVVKILKGPPVKKILVCHMHLTNGMGFQRHTHFFCPPPMGVIISRGALWPF